MPVIEPTQPRYVVEELPGELVCTVPSRRNWFAILFIGFWLVGWTIGEVVVIAILVTGFLAGLQNGFAAGPGGWGIAAFLLAWLGGWTIGGMFAIYAWLWNIRGQERIAMTLDYLCLEKRIPLFGRFGRSKEYRMNSISALRLMPQPVLPWGVNEFGQFSGYKTGALGFDYGASTIRFGQSLDDAEAKQILGHIAKHFPQIVERRGDTA